MGVTGLIHGLEPGHGWPLAVMLSRRQARTAGYAGFSASILGLGHLVSSFAVVSVFIGLDQVIDFSSDVFRYIAAGVLALIAVKLWLEKGHADAGAQAETIGLGELVVMALVLGFAHEEEFILLALAVGGLNPVVMMSVYAVAVLASMVLVTLAAYYSFRFFEQRFDRVAPYLPKVTAVALTVIALLFLLNVY